jgi:peptide/nickel transport system substrate-binding protein
MRTDTQCSRRQFLRMSALAAAASLVAACAAPTPTPPPPKPGETPKPAATHTPTKAPAAAVPVGPVEVALPYHTYDSWDSAFWTSQLLLAQGTIREGLYGYDDKLNVIPKVAESGTSTPDFKVWTYKLRKDKKWANGDPVTARDFYSAWMRFMGPELRDAPMWAGAWPYIHNAWAYKGGAVPAEEVGLKLIDDHTLEVTLNQPFPSFTNALVMAQHMPIHSKMLEERPNDWWQPQYGVFNGPFVVRDWVGGGETTLARNPNYVGERYGNVDTIYLKPFPDATARLAAFENGDLHFSFLDDVAQVAYVERDARLKEGLREEIALSWSGLQYNRAFDSGPFARLEVRQAFAMAIDKAAIVDKVMRGMAIPANAFTGDPGVAGNVKPLEYNVAKARELLAAAGYPGGRGLGDVVFNAPPAGSGPMPLVEAIAKMWEDNLGVKVVIQNMDWGPYSTLQWSDVNKDIPPGYSTMGGAINFIEPMGLYQNVGHIWWFMEFDPAWNKTKYWEWRDRRNAVDGITKAGDFAALQRKADALWSERLKIIAAEDNDWGKSMMVEPTFEQSFAKIAQRFRDAKDDAERLAAYQDGTRMVIGEERGLDNYASMTETNREAHRLMASLFLARMEDANKYLVPLNQMAIDSAWMIPIHIGKLIYVVDPKLSGIVQNKLSWGNIFQFQYLNYGG